MLSDVAQAAFLPAGELAAGDLASLSHFRPLYLFFGDPLARTGQIIAAKGKLKKRVK